MECWGIGVLKKKDINPAVITPTLHYAHPPKLIEIESPPRWITFSHKTTHTTRSFTFVPVGPVTTASPVAVRAVAILCSINI